MKKIKRILLAVTFILCSVMMFACGKNSKDNTKVYDGVTYVHDPENKRITAGGHTYSYIWSEYGYRDEDGYGYEEEYEDGYIISITYPDGEEVVVRYGENNVSSEEHRLQGKEYADPLNLGSMIKSYLDSQEKKPVQVPLIIGGVVTFIIGVVMVGAPELGFKLRYWAIENAEQSETSKGVSIAFGIIFMIAGVIMALVGIF